MPDVDDEMAAVFSLVADLERDFYTRREIHDALMKAAEEIRPSGGFDR